MKERMEQEPCVSRALAVYRKASRVGKKLRICKKNGHKHWGRIGSCTTPTPPISARLPCSTLAGRTPAGRRTQTGASARRPRCARTRRAGSPCLHASSTAQRSQGQRKEQQDKLQGHFGTAAPAIDLQRPALGPAAHRNCPAPPRPAQPSPAPTHPPAKCASHTSSWQ